MVNAVTCTQGPTPRNPLTYDMNPTMFMVTNCIIYGGNSGGAVVLREDPLAILGVVSASNNARTGNTSYPLKVSADNGEDHATFTNARCFAMPAWPQMESGCVDYSEAKIKELANAERKRNKTTAANP